MDPTARFTDRACDYVAGRPQYPAAAIDALLSGLGDPATLDVADLGAGTGISSRALAARGCRVVAVEPNSAMRESGENARTLRWHASSAETTGLPDGAFDLVTAFQAFHWFAYDVALAEMTRIARRGGRAALVYNTRDENDAATSAYSAIVRGYARDRGADARRRTDGIARFEAHAGWSAVARSTFRNEQTLDRAGVRARAFSTSYLPKEGSQTETLQAELDAFFDRFARDGTLVMRMDTVVTIASIA